MAMDILAQTEIVENIKEVRVTLDGWTCGVCGGLFAFLVVGFYSGLFVDAFGFNIPPSFVGRV